MISRQRSHLTEMLRKSLALPGIRDYIVSAQTPEEAAADLLAAAGRLAE